jgi:hypothetical protein
MDLTKSKILEGNATCRLHRKTPMTYFNNSCWPAVVNFLSPTNGQTTYGTGLLVTFYDKGIFFLIFKDHFTIFGYEPYALSSTVLTQRLVGNVPLC